MENLHDSEILSAVDKNNEIQTHMGFLEPDSTATSTLATITCVTMNSKNESQS